MGSDNHVTIDAIGALARRELPPDKVQRIAKHLGECERCAALAQQSASTRDVADVFDIETLDHPRVDPDLAAYVDGILPAARRREISAHLLTCERCREDVADLEQVRARIVKKTPWFAYAAAAMLVIALVAIALWPRGPLRRVVAPPQAQQQQQKQAAPPTPPVVNTSTTYDRPDWKTAVADAVRTGTVPHAAILAEIHASADTLRGTESTQPVKLDPAGVVIETTTPQFKWTPFDDSRYVVSVFNGDRKVVTSGKIGIATWKSSKPLARGTTFTWQVEVLHDSKSDIIPAPPNPPAMFHIVDDATMRDLDAARERYPDDHLLLGVLYARAGLEARAREELRKSGSAVKVTSATDEAY